MPPLRLPSTPEARAPTIAAALSSIKGTDPGFDANSLLSALPARYLALRQAAAESDDARLRVYLTPALLEHWGDSGPQEGSPQAGAGDLSVQEVRLIWAERLLWEDRLTLGVDSLAMADEEVHALTEYWTLARRRSVETDTGAPATECPACGAPAVPDDDVCHYCDAELPGPLRGWLLDRVDQDVDWYEGPAGLVV